MSEAPQRRYDIIAVQDEVPGVKTLRLLSGGVKPPFLPGQFITVYFPELHVPEGKAYSISSSPDEPALALTIKAMGAFSNRLTAMRADDSLTGSDPYGFFYSEEKGTPLVMLGIGIGVTPFRSLIRAYLVEEPERSILLCSGSRTEAGIVFKEEWEALAAAHPSFRVAHFISRQETVPPRSEKGRMSAERVLPLVREPKRSEFMLCGSISFVRDLWRGLRSAGIPEEKLYTEAFFTN